LKELVSSLFYLRQLLAGISKKIHPHPAKIWLVVDRAFQKGQVTFVKDEEQVSVATGNRLAASQGTEKPNFGNFRVFFGQVLRRSGQSASHFLRVQPVDFRRS
jgi:hypothetical protein